MLRPHQAWGQIHAPFQVEHGSSVHLGTLALAVYGSHFRKPWKAYLSQCFYHGFVRVNVSSWGKDINVYGAVTNNVHQASYEEQ